jgi:UDP-2,3-diacylglucosamine pyrophosphatase LpxH
MLNRVTNLLRARPDGPIPQPSGASFYPSGLTADFPPETSPAEPAPRHYRTLWISDIHLGTAGCQARYLLDFLKHNESDTLYLVGDIIDGWQLRKGWYWPQAHNDVVQKILRSARKGTRVVYIPGNHDELLRQFIGLSLGEIAIVEDAIHTTADGRKLWVVHGDAFDGVMRHARWLAHVGDWSYVLLLKLNRWLNAIRQRMGLPYWSMSQYIKHQVKNAVNFISDFEHVMTDQARKRGCDGVVCGHIHKAEVRQIDGILYCNDGDWVESLTALVESFDGEIKLVHWRGRVHAPLNLGRILEEPVEPPMEALVT